MPSIVIFTGSEDAIWGGWGPAIGFSDTDPLDAGNAFHHEALDFLAYLIPGSRIEVTYSGKTPQIYAYDDISTFPSNEIVRISRTSTTGTVATFTYATIDTALGAKNISDLEALVLYGEGENVTITRVELFYDPGAVGSGGPTPCACDASCTGDGSSCVCVCIINCDGIDCTCTCDCDSLTDTPTTPPSTNTAHDPDFFMALRYDISAPSWTGRQSPTVNVSANGEFNFIFSGVNWTGIGNLGFFIPIQPVGIGTINMRLSRIYVNGYVLLPSRNVDKIIGASNTEGMPNIGWNDPSAATFASESGLSTLHRVDGNGDFRFHANGTIENITSLVFVFNATNVPTVAGVADAFMTAHSHAVTRTVTDGANKVAVIDKAQIEAAQTAFGSQQAAVRANLAGRSPVIDAAFFAALLEEIEDQIANDPEGVAASFEAAHAAVLALRVTSVTPANRLAVLATQAAFGLLPEPVKDVLNARTFPINAAFFASLLVEIADQEGSGDGTEGDHIVRIVGGQPEVASGDFRFDVNVPTTLTYTGPSLSAPNWFGLNTNLPNALNDAARTEIRSLKVDGVVVPLGAWRNYSSNESNIGGSGRLRLTIHNEWNAGFPNRTALAGMTPSFTNLEITFIVYVDPTAYATANATAATAFMTTHGGILDLTAGTVEVTDQGAVTAARTAFIALTNTQRTLLTPNNLTVAFFDALLNEIATQIANDPVLQVSVFESDHAAVLALTTATVQAANIAAVTNAQLAFNALIPSAQAILAGRTPPINAAFFTALLDAARTPSLDYTKAMGMGWNLGNSFDSIGGGTTVSSWEQAWGNPTVTRALIRAVRRHGFDHIRIPFTIDTRGTDRGAATPAGQIRYEISQQWLARYKQVVDWALAEGLYVMINIHHDSWYWLGRNHSENPMGTAWNGSTDPSNPHFRRFQDYWIQLSQTFAYAGDRLMFETINEPEFHGVPGNSNGFHQGALDAINLAAYDIIRATPGNENRMIVIPTLKTDHTHSSATSNWILARNDPNLIATVHYYSEWVFGNPLGMTRFEEQLFGDGTTVKSAADDFFGTLETHFLSNGIGVSVGEWGLLGYDHDLYAVALQKGEELKYYEYMQYMARKNSVSLSFWDNVSGINRVNGRYDWRIPKVGAMLTSKERSSYSTGLDTLYFNEAVTANVDIPLTMNGNTFTGVSLLLTDEDEKTELVPLTQGTDFTFAADTLTLTEAFVNRMFGEMDAKEYGVFAALVLQFSGGADWNQYLVKNETPVFYPASGVRNRGGWNWDSLVIPVDYKGNWVRRVSAFRGTTPGTQVGGNHDTWWPYLEYGSAYRVDYENGTLTLRRGFFTSSVQTGVNTIVVEFQDGTRVDFIIDVAGTANSSAVTSRSSLSAAAEAAMFEYYQEYVVNLTVRSVRLRDRAAIAAAQTMFDRLSAGARVLLADDGINAAFFTALLDQIASRGSPETDPEPGPGDECADCGEAPCVCQIEPVIEEADEDEVLGLIEEALEDEADFITIIVEGDGASLSEEAIAALVEAGLSVVIETANGSFEMSLDILANLESKGGDLVIGSFPYNTNALDEDTAGLVGDRPVHRAFATIGGEPVTNFGGMIVVTIPYDLGEDEDPDAIVVKYINKEGDLELRRGFYCEEAKAVIFITSSFSLYMIDHYYFDYLDAARIDTWAKSYVTFATASRVFQGSAGSFMPRRNITVQEIVTVLSNIHNGMNAFLLEDWPAAYIAWGEEFGLYGGKEFDFRAPATRSEMAFLIYNFITITGMKLETADGVRFTDLDGLDGSCVKAIEALANFGIIVGDTVDGKPSGIFRPGDEITRQEVAVIITRLICNFI
jgi:endoglucanase